MLNENSSFKIGNATGNVPIRSVIEQGGFIFFRWIQSKMGGAEKTCAVHCKSWIIRIGD
jgi:hypothetical protein